MLAAANRPFDERRGRGRGTDHGSVEAAHRHRNRAAASAGERISVGDDDRLASLIGPQPGSVLVILLQKPKGDVIGALRLINARAGSGAVVPFDLELAALGQALAPQAAAAIRNAQLEEPSFKDPLTGVHNRRYSRNFSVVTRYGGDEFAVLLVDTPKSGPSHMPDASRTRRATRVLPQIADRQRRGRDAAGLCHRQRRTRGRRGPRAVRGQATRPQSRRIGLAAGSRLDRWSPGGPTPSRARYTAAMWNGPPARIS